MKTSILSIGLVGLSAACSANGGGGFNRDAATTGNDVTVSDTPSSQDTGVNHPDVQSSVCGSSPSSISGRVFAPNGVDPLPGVEVRVVADSTTFPPASTTVMCQTCAATSTLSGPDGGFQIIGGQLDMGGTFTVVFSSGGFRHVQRHVTVGMCGSVTLTAAQTSLPGSPSGDDTVPRIAVGASSTHASDVNDHFTRVLDAIGITAYDQIDPSRSGTSSGSNDLIALLSDMTRLSQYQIVAAPCGSLGNFSVAQNLTPQMITNLQTWLGQGGRLYASDLAYSVIDKAYPGGITFANGTPTRTADPADIGQGFTGAAAATTPISGTIVDTQLLAWLRSVGVLTSTQTTMDLFEFRNPWGAMDNIPDAELTGHTGPSGVILVSGNVTWTDGRMGNHPLTAMVDYAAPNTGTSCGRVVFSSYHVQSSTTGMGNALTGQERILEYLFFRLSTCIQIPG